VTYAEPSIVAGATGIAGSPPPLGEAGFRADRRLAVDRFRLVLALPLALALPFLFAFAFFFISGPLLKRHESLPGRSLDRIAGCRAGMWYSNARPTSTGF
jgi:hypothetical protein